MKVGWDSTLKTNIILADIFDVLNSIAHGLGGSKHRVKPYPRPFEDKKEDKKFGKGAVASVDELREFFEVKRNGR